MPFLGILSLNKTSIPSFPPALRQTAEQITGLHLGTILWSHAWGSPGNQDEQKSKRFASHFILTPGHALLAPRQSIMQSIVTFSLPPSPGSLSCCGYAQHTQCNFTVLLQVLNYRSRTGFHGLATFIMSSWPPSNKGLIWSPLEFHKPYQYYSWTLKPLPCTKTKCRLFHHWVKENSCYYCMCSQKTLKGRTP